MRKHTKNCCFHRIIDSPLFHFDSSIKRVHTTDTSLWTWGNTRRTVLIIDQLIRVMFLIEIWLMSQIGLVSHPKTIFAFVPWIKTSCQLSSLLFIRFGNGVKSCSISLLSVRQCWTEQLKSFVGDTGLSSSMVIPNAVENLVSSHSDLSTDTSHIFDWNLADISNLVDISSENYICLRSLNKNFLPIIIVAFYPVWQWCKIM